MLYAYNILSGTGVGGVRPRPTSNSLRSETRVTAKQSDRSLVLRVAACTKARTVDPDGRLHARWTCVLRPCSQSHQNIRHWQHRHKVSTFTVTEICFSSRGNGSRSLKLTRNSAETLI